MKSNKFSGSALIVLGSLTLVLAGCAGGDGTDPGPSAMATMEGPVVAPAPVELVPQKTCPVMGGEIDKEVFLDYEGQRVYFCCGGCENDFLEDPDAYLKILKKRGEKAEDIQ